MNRELLRAAASAVTAVMRRRHIADQVRLIAAGDPWAWPDPDPELAALAAECDAVLYDRRTEPDDLADRLAAVLGDRWEP